MKSINSCTSFIEYVRDLQKIVLEASLSKQALAALDDLKPAPPTITSVMEHGTREEAVADYKYRLSLTK